MEKITHAMKNGLVRSTEKDLSMLKTCMAQAVSFSTIWEDRNDYPKFIEWDDKWEKYLEHRAALIDEEGRERYLPWNAYKELGLNWLDGYAFEQQVGDCGSFGAKNSLKASNFTNALRTGRKPKEIANSMMYAIARGDGHVAFGNGCNLAPLAKYSAEVGNYWTDDFGRYNAGVYCRKYKKGSEQDDHAHKTQSIVVFVPEANFEYCFKACSAGFGINIGSSVFPGASKLNSDNLGQVSDWDCGGHCMALVAAWKAQSGKPYVYIENSHPTKYAADSLNSGRQWGCWLDEDDINKRLGNGAYDYGVWYVNVGELPE